jgi:hypothetical protein
MRKPRPKKGNAPAAQTVGASSAQNQPINERTRLMNSNTPGSKSEPIPDSDKTCKPVGFIRFHGLSLLVVENCGLQYIEGKLLTDLCGINWKSAKVTIKTGDNAVLYGTKALYPPRIGGLGSASTPQNVEDGVMSVPRNEILFIRLDRSRIFLARVNTSHMKAQGNAAGAGWLLNLQIEWAEVLHAYETNGVAIKKGRRDDLGDLGLLYKLRGMAETNAERAALSRQIGDQHNEMGYPLIDDEQQASLFDGGTA